MAPLFPDLDCRKCSFHELYHCGGQRELRELHGKEDSVNSDGQATNDPRVRKPPTRVVLPQGELVPEVHHFQTAVGRRIS